MLGIYVHLPFCLRKCDYCDFFSVPAARDEVPGEAYLAAVKAQLERDVVAWRLEGREVGSVYFGGGTPSLLPPAFFTGVLASLRERFTFADDLEVSCEVNPAMVDLVWFAGAREAGISRTSIGVQSFQPDLLVRLGRIHTADEAMLAIAEAQQAGFQSVSCDLMFGIPGETMADLEEDLRTAMTFQPEHLSAYQLTIQEGTPLYEIQHRAKEAEKQRSKKAEKEHLSLSASQPLSFFPSEDESLSQMRAVARMLSRSGWQRYEISNFARPGFECRHNRNYWRYGEYLGLGAGATSFLCSGPGAGSVFARRFTQLRNVQGYIARSTELAEDEMIEVRTAMAEFCFLGLRTTEGISAQGFEARFGYAFDSLFGEAVRALEGRGLIEKKGDYLALTPRGVELSNQVFEKFLP